MSRLSKLEKELAVRSMEFVKAGEWPWTAQNDGTTDKQEQRERAALDRAIDKLSGPRG